MIAVTARRHVVQSTSSHAIRNVCAWPVNLSPARHLRPYCRSLARGRAGQDNTRANPPLRLAVLGPTAVWTTLLLTASSHSTTRPPGRLPGPGLRRHPGRSRAPSTSHHQFTSISGRRTSIISSSQVVALRGRVAHFGAPTPQNADGSRPSPARAKTYGHPGGQYLINTRNAQPPSAPSGASAPPPALLLHITLHTTINIGAYALPPRAAARLRRDARQGDNRMYNRLPKTGSTRFTEAHDGASAGDGLGRALPEG